jgi:hypothetical protein
VVWSFVCLALRRSLELVTICFRSAQAKDIEICRARGAAHTCLLEGRGPMQRANQQVHLIKNLALAGGSIMAFVLFAGLGHDLGLTITGPLFNLRRPAAYG